MIELQNVSYTYKTRKGHIKALSEVSLDIENEKTTVLLGYNGCGKTTLLKILSGIIENFAGEIVYNGVPFNKVNFKKLNIAYVTQEYILYPHLTVFDNIAFPLKQLKLKPEDIYTKINEIAYYLDIEDILTRRPKHISRGQQQRVAIAKALVKNPSILLMDEPFSNIDAQTRSEFNQIIKLLQRKQNMTLVYVTHNIHEAFFLADKIYVLNEGQVEISGSPDEIMNSGNPIIHDLINAGEIRWK